MYVKDFMHTAVTTVTPDTLVSTAYQMLRGGQMRHLPVVTDEGTSLGLSLTAMSAGPQPPMRRTWPSMS